MKWLLPFVAACYTARLGAVADPQLHTAEHGKPFVLRGGGRVGPDTEVRFRNAGGEWSDAHAARDLHVDGDGMWIDGRAGFLDGADAIDIDGITPEIAQAIEAARPPGAEFTRDGTGVHLAGSWPTLMTYANAIELAVARLEPVARIESRPVLSPDDGHLYSLEVTHAGEPLGTWIVGRRGGDAEPLSGLDLVTALHGFRDASIGWHWRDIAAVEVANVSGPKTFGAIVGYTALAAALAVIFAPVALVSRGGNFPSIPFGGGGDATPAGKWAPDVSGRSDAPALFSTGARVRGIAAPSIALDTSIALRGDMIGTGAIARVTLAEIFELGGGVRVDAVRGHGVSTTGLFQAGLRLPLDERDRFAVPLGVEIGGGGAIAHDLRLPWGLRGTRGRWILTVSPATAEHVRIDGVRAGRWGITSGFEIGASL